MIFGVILIVVIIFIAIVLIKNDYGSPEYIGKKGEENVADILDNLDKEKYLVLYDNTIPGLKGTTQIDHIVVSEYGIYVIETKNYSGDIYGSANSEKWTENFYGNKYKFHNPVRQNYGHLKSLAAYLGRDINDFISLVVFTGAGEIMTEVPDNVIYASELLSVIYSYQTIRITDDIHEIADKIIAIDNNYNGKEKEHTENIYNNLREDNEKIEQMICPKCGGNLVLRNGRYGQFYGCSNYPKCHFTKDI